MRKSVTRKTIKQNSQKTVRKVSNNQKEFTENSAQGTNATESNKTQRKQCARKNSQKS